ncbi:MAG: hypothetical protein WCO30_00275 [bacterium]
MNSKNLISLVITLVTVIGLTFASYYMFPTKAMGTEVSKQVVSIKKEAETSLKQIFLAKMAEQGFKETVIIEHVKNTGIATKRARISGEAFKVATISPTGEQIYSWFFMGKNTGTIKNIQAQGEWITRKPAK